MPVYVVKRCDAEGHELTLHRNVSLHPLITIHDEWKCTESDYNELTSRHGNLYLVTTSYQVFMTR